VHDDFRERVDDDDDVSAESGEADSPTSSKVDEEVVVDRFVWPPRPLVDHARRPASVVHSDIVRRVPEEHDQRSASESARPDLVAGPASRLGELVTTSADSNGLQSNLDPGCGSWWKVIERGWLGLRGFPLSDRIEADGWSPDTPDAYCRSCGRSTRPETRPTVLNGSQDRTQSRGVDVSCGHSGADGMGSRCSRCAGEREPPWDVVVRLSSYREPMAGVVRDIKFTRWRSLGVEAGRLLGESIAGELEPGWPCIVPVPISYRRRVARGIDHTAAIALGVRQVLGGEVGRILGRKHRPSQTSLSAEQRRRNLAGAIWSRRPPPIGRTVVVIDDVMTTGATMRAACGAIRAAERALHRRLGTGKNGQGKGVGVKIRIVVAVLAVAEDAEDLMDSEYIEPETGMLG